MLIDEKRKAKKQPKRDPNKPREMQGKAGDKGRFVTVKRKSDGEDEDGEEMGGEKQVIFIPSGKAKDDGPPKRKGKRGKRSEEIEQFDALLEAIEQSSL